MKLKHLTAVLLCVALTVSMIPSFVLADETEGETGKTEATETTETTPKETSKPTEKEKKKSSEATTSETEASETESSKESESGSETTETAAPSESVPSEEPTEPSESSQPTKKTVPAETHKSSKKGTVILSGACDQETTWTLEDNGTLTFSGFGRIYNKDNSYGWQDYKSSIKKVVVNSPVYFIGAEAFSGCTNLTEVSIADSVSTIGYSAFEGCTGLKSITLPESVNSIGSSAFKDCENLESITILSDDLTTIPESFVEGCSSLKAINIPDTVKTIYQHAFRGCSSLTSVVIPDKVFYLSYYLFQDCTSLKSVKLPNGITAIDSGAFSGCSSLQELTIPDSVTEIKTGAFKDCTSLKNINIPSGITTLDSSLFKGCTSLEKISIPESVTKINSSVFSGCIKLESITLPVKLTTLGSGAFYKCSSLKAIKIPDGVTEFKSELFRECTNLASVTFSEDVTSIESYCFYNTKLTSFTIPKNVKSIYSRTFQGCKYLATVTIPKSVTYVGEYAFAGCESLSDVNYAGSENTWKNVTVKANNAPLLNATFHYGEQDDVYYNIKVNNGTADAQTAISGTKIKLTAEPVLEGKYFSKWIADSDKVKFVDSHAETTTFTMPEIDVEITAVYKDKHSIKVNNGTSDVSSAIEDKMITITADVIEGKRFYEWIVVSDNVTLGSAYGSTTSFIMPDEDVEITATYRDIHSIKVNNGTANPSTSLSGYTVIITADEAPSGKAFRKWEVKSGHVKLEDERSSTTHFKMPDENVEITALYGDFHSVTVKNGSADNTSAVEGKTIKIKATVPDDKLFDKWVVSSGNVQVNNVYNSTTYFSMPDEDVVIEATFKDPYLATGTCGEELEWKITYDGILYITGSGAMYDDPNYGWESYSNEVTHVSIYGDVTSIGNKAFYGFTSLYSLYLPNSVTSIGNSVFDGCIKLNYIEYDGKTEDWYKIAVGTGNDYIEEIYCSDSSQSLYKVKVSSGSSDPTMALPDSTVTLTADAAPEGKVFDRWEVNSGGITIDDPYSSKTSFKMVDNVVLVTATYKEAPSYSVNTTIEGNGSIELDQSSGITGTKITIKATPDDGYYFKEWQVVSGGITLEDPSSPETTFTIGSSDVTVKAVFEEIVPATIGDTFNFNGYAYTIKNNAVNGTGCVSLTGPDSSSNPIVTLSIPSTVTDKGVIYKVTSIGPDAFRNNTSIKIVSLGSNIIVIGNNAFYGCTSLQKVSGGSKLKTIGTGAFARCSKLSSFTITSKYLSKIGTYAFNKDYKLKTIYIRNTTRLTKSGVKKSLKGSSVKTVRVKKSKVKKYKKYFTKKNCGRKIKVKK